MKLSRPYYGLEDTHLFKEFSQVVLVHLVILLFFWGGSKLDVFNGGAKEKAIVLPSQLRSAVRVDVVAMPEMTLKELKNLAPVDMTSAQTALVEESNKKQESQAANSAEKSQSFHDFLKQASKKKIVTTKKNSKGADLDQKALGSLKSLVLQGNKLSQGTAVEGAVNSQSLTELERYVAGLPLKIKPHWKLPSYMLEKGYHAQIRIFLSEKGELIKYEFMKKSESEEFNQRALQALKAAIPLPAPPKDIKLHLLQGKVVLSFPL